MMETKKTIGLITPSHCLSEPRDQWVRDGIEVLKSWGHRIKEGKYLWASDKYGVSAGTVKERVEDLHNIFLDPEVDIVWFSQGGDTSNELLREIDFDLIKANPKIVIGLSDVTVLLNAILAKTGMITFHGSDPKAVIGEDWYLLNEYTKSEFQRVILNDIKGTFPKLNERKRVRSGKAEGRFLGGNLQCFRKSIGTPYMPELEGSILIVEGLSTNIEESMTLLAHYKSAGVFDKIAGLVIGDFYAFDREGQYALNGERVYFEDLVLEVTSEFDFPILKTRDFGHRLGNTFIPLGRVGYVDAGKVEWGVV